LWWLLVGQERVMRHAGSATPTAACRTRLVMFQLYQPRHYRSKYKLYAAMPSYVLMCRCNVYISYCTSWQKIKQMCCPGLLYCSSAAAVPSHVPLLLLFVL
jgi:hypothetical protein